MNSIEKVFFFLLIAQTKGSKIRYLDNGFSIDVSTKAVITISTWKKERRNEKNFVFVKLHICPVTDGLLFYWTRRFGISAARNEYYTVHM